ncbi:hypothetical protein [Acidianus manzaensis]|uniref:Uncharacterized protein n=1 Tax=Acidianus manzaensis TaxID=282676 RepID=A0A1W6JX15_9CREN|nr:hypothetical protein [Acidianus manzaensis]ARM74770.1 hypothetical protein B6F84_01170 [Acidianus manzaensis]
MKNEIMDLEKLVYMSNLGDINARAKLQNYMIEQLITLKKKNIEKIKQNYLSTVINNIELFLVENKYQCPLCNFKSCNIIDFYYHLLNHKDRKHSDLLYKILYC